MIRKSIKNTIKEHFLTYPTAKLRVRGIERTLKLALPSIIRYCKELRTEGILAITKIGNVVFLTADRTNPNYLLEKRLFNIKQLYLSGLIKHLREALSNPPVIVFGSYARGEDIEDSDIDLYIETPSKKSINLESFEKFLHRRIQVFRHEGIHSVKNPHLANNIMNGITLNSSVEVFR